MPTIKIIIISNSCSNIKLLILIYIYIFYTFYFRCLIIDCMYSIFSKMKSNIFNKILITYTI